MAKWRRNKSLSRRWQKNHLISKYGSVCYLCKEPFTSIKEATIDHWIPKSKGGVDDISNYRLAHDRCNSLKSNLSPDEFVEFQQSDRL